MSINQWSLAIVTSSPQPSHAWESENVKLEKGAVRLHCETFRGKCGDSDEFCMLCFLSHHPFVAVLSPEIFFCLAQKHGDMTFTHWSRASLLQVHPLTGLMIENVGWVRSGLPFFFFSPSFWHFDIAYRINVVMTNVWKSTQLIDGTLPVMHQSLSW